MMMVGNPYRWRASIPQLENRNATAGCLLSVLFVVPYLAKSGQVSTIPLALLVASYVGLVVPLLTGILSKKTLLLCIRSTVAAITDPECWKDFFRLIYFILEWSHFLYLQLEGVHVTTMQVMFNLAAEKVLCPEEKLCCLYVLLFYSVLAYLQRALQDRPWAHLLTESSTAEFIKLTTAFMIVRLGKAVALSLVMLTISIQFKHMDPSVSFVALTFTYFCLTQYQSAEFVTRCMMHGLRWVELQFLEGMEELWVPFLIHSSMVALAVIIAVAGLISTNSYLVLLIFGYTNILVPTIQFLEKAWAPLAKERQNISKFPLASWKNPEIRSGGLCAICLDKLRLLSARITRCGHVFHGACLRRSLHYSSRCPLCKSPL